MVASVRLFSQCLCNPSNGRNNGTSSLQSGSAPLWTFLVGSREQGHGETAKDRERLGETWKDRERLGETGKDRERLGETGRDRERLGETGKDRERL